MGRPQSYTGGLWGQSGSTVPVLRLPARAPLNNDGGVDFRQQGTNFMWDSGQLSDGIMLIITGVDQIQDLY